MYGSYYIMFNNFGLSVCLGAFFFLMTMHIDLPYSFYSLIQCVIQMLLFNWSPFVGDYVLIFQY